MNLTIEIERNVTAALEEDMGGGDLTAMLIAEGTLASAQIICRVDAVLCGTPWFDASRTFSDSGITPISGVRRISWMSSSDSIWPPATRFGL